MGMCPPGGKRSSLDLRGWWGGACSGFERFQRLISEHPRVSKTCRGASESTSDSEVRRGQLAAADSRKSGRMLITSRRTSSTVALDGVSARPASARKNQSYSAGEALPEEL